MVLCFLAYTFLSLTERAENSFVGFSMTSQLILEKSELMLETAWLPQSPHGGAAKPR